ncbi:MAG: uridine phosphorylase [Anaerolineae bacterium]
MDEVQYHIQMKKGDVGRYVLLPGDPGRCALIAERFENAVLVAQNREFTTYTGTLDGVKVSVTSTGIGAPSTAIAVEELARIGADTFIRVGTSGGMQLEVKPGDLVIGTAAVRDEGTTIQYIPLAYPAVASYEVVNALIEAAEKRQVRYHVGILHSKDSFYGQHLPETMPAADYLLSRWKAWLRGNVLASEMEASTIFTVCSIKRLRAGCIVLAAANQEIAKLEGKREVVHDLTNLIDVAVEGLRVLIRRDAEKKPG